MIGRLQSRSPLLVLPLAGGPGAREPGGSRGAAAGAGAETAAAGRAGVVSTVPFESCRNQHRVHAKRLKTWLSLVVSRKATNCPPLLHVPRSPLSCNDSAQSTVKGPY